MVSFLFPFPTTARNLHPVKFSDLEDRYLKEN